MVKFDLIQLLNTFNFFKQVIDIYILTNKCVSFSLDAYRIYV